MAISGLAAVCGRARFDVRVYAPARMLGQVSCQNDFSRGSDARLGDSIGRKVEFKMARSLSAPSQTDDASADQPRRQLRLGLRLRSVVTGAIAPLSHELVELGPVLGKAQAL